MKRTVSAINSILLGAIVGEDVSEAERHSAGGALVSPDEQCSSPSVALWNC